MLICESGGAGEPPLREMCGLFARVDMDPVDLIGLLLSSRPRVDGWVLRVGVSGSRGSVLVYGVFFRWFLLCW